MLDQKDILSTLDMIDNQHLDIRTITMGINASNKIWVYDPMEPAERSKTARARRPAKSRA